ncbi:hypothetical protein V3C99_002311, partial [Haemonchus contortus]
AASDGVVDSDVDFEERRLGWVGDWLHIAPGPKQVPDWSWWCPGPARHTSTNRQNLLCGALSVEGLPGFTLPGV